MKKVAQSDFYHIEIEVDYNEHFPCTRCDCNIVDAVMVGAK